METEIITLCYFDVHCRHSKNHFNITREEARAITRQYMNTPTLLHVDVWIYDPNTHTTTTYSYSTRTKQWKTNTIILTPPPTHRGNQTTKTHTTPTKITK